MRRLVMWDIDYTLLRGGDVAAQAWMAAFTEVTGLPWQATPSFGGRTDLDICAEVFATHGVTDCTPERFFARYVEQVHAARHLFAERGTLLPGVRSVLDALGARTNVVQTLVTGNVPQVAAAKIAAFGLTADFDAEVGGYGTDDSVRATLVRRCRERAEAKYGEQFQPVVIGDTAHDITAALANDAVAIGVATGAPTAADLARAGAHVVLPDLTDVRAAVTAIAEATPDLTNGRGPSRP
ncbi:haloacid dehalogenase-like hydrolase [Actinoplanes sp. NPDC051859]|uniref:haloacid dehalogenase-like hydrolase n=1 Tax=Actinoplanes sp. NPDC051859 TaxID=3363909 RepID=UPI00379758AF